MSETATAVIVGTAAAAILAFVFSPIAAAIAVRIGAVDSPGERKIHVTPIPRLGGLAVIAAVSLVWLVESVAGLITLPAEFVIGTVAGLVPIVLISIVDDIRSTKPAWKLTAHFLGSSLAVAAGLSLGPEIHLFGRTIEIGWFAYPLSILWLVGVTNAFNIIDGLDGLSAGLALISALSMAAVFTIVEQPMMTAAVMVVAGALVGFLPFNVHPARLFLGDTGATAVGFCLAGFALKGGSTLSSGFAVVVPIFILGLPLADMTISVVRRLIKGGKQPSGSVFVADRNHVHHRLLALGLGHSRAVVILYATGCAFAAIAFVSMFLRARDAALFVAAMLVASLVGIQRLEYDEFAFIRKGSVLPLYETRLLRKALFVGFIDLVMMFAGVFIAVGLKFDSWALSDLRPMVVDLSATLSPLTILVFWRMGLYKGSWRSASVSDLAKVSAACALVAISGAALHSLISDLYVPPSLFVVFALVNLVIVTSSRSSYVLLTQWRRPHASGRLAAVYDCGGSGVAVMSELLRNPQLGLQPVGFIDDENRMAGRTIVGKPVLGSSKQLRRILRQHKLEAVVLPPVGGSPASREAIHQACSAKGVEVLSFKFHLESDATPDGGLERSHNPRKSADDFTAGPLCPDCETRALKKATPRTVVERIRWRRHHLSLFECTYCSWRGWLSSDPAPKVVALADGRG